MLGAGALGWPRGMVQGGRWEGGSGWGTRVHLWQNHVVAAAAAAAAAAKSLQSCPTLCDPMDCSPSGSSIRGILQARALGWGAIAFSENHVDVWQNQYDIVK